MIRYINIKSVYGVETVDNLDRKDFTSYKEFKKELNMLISEYKIAGMNVYNSQRCNKEYNN